MSAEILARSLANFYCQYADRHMNYNLCDASASESGQFYVIIKKQIDVSFKCVCPVIDNKFRHNIVKVVCGSTQLSRRGSAVTLTMS